MDSTLAERIRERARLWLNKKHFTSDSGVTLDCLAMLPDDHALALTIGQLATIASAFALSELSAAEQAARKEERELCCKDVCAYCADPVNWEPSGFFATAAYEAAWRHQRKTPDNCGRTQYALECKAAAIRTTSRKTK